MLPALLSCCCQVILNEEVDTWPLCDVLLSWHSEGFPLRKAQAYVELRRPFLINDGGCASSLQPGRPGPKAAAAPANLSSCSWL